MLVQLRIYTINRGALQAFAQEWEASIRPLREKLGFQVLGAWMVKETNQFVWLLAYEGPGDWNDKDRAYYDSEQRRAMVPDPARHIARVEQYFVESAMI